MLKKKLLACFPQDKFFSFIFICIKFYNNTLSICKQPSYKIGGNKTIKKISALSYSKRLISTLRYLITIPEIIPKKLKKNVKKIVKKCQKNTKQSRNSSSLNIFKTRTFCF